MFVRTTPAANLRSAPPGRHLVRRPARMSGAGRRGVDWPTAPRPPPRLSIRTRSDRDAAGVTAGVAPPVRRFPPSVKGYHSDKTLVALDEIGIRSYVSEPERGQRCWQDKKTGETPPEKRAAQRALYGNRRRIRGARGRRLQRGRSELVERPFAHQYETGGLRRVWVRGHDNVRKRVLIQAAGCNIGLLLRRLTGVGTPRSLQGRVLSAIYGLIGRLIDRWGRLTSPWGSKWRPAAFVGSIAHRQAA